MMQSFGSYASVLQVPVIYELFVIEMSVLEYDPMLICCIFLPTRCSEEMQKYKDRLSRSAFEELSINGNLPRCYKVFEFCHDVLSFSCNQIVQGVVTLSL